MGRPLPGSCLEVCVACASGRPSRAGRGDRAPREKPCRGHDPSNGCHRAERLEAGGHAGNRHANGGERRNCHSRGRLPAALEPNRANEGRVGTPPRDPDRSRTTLGRAPGAKAADAFARPHPGKIFPNETCRGKLRRCEIRGQTSEIVIEDPLARATVDRSMLRDLKVRL